MHFSDWGVRYYLHFAREGGEKERASIEERKSCIVKGGSGEESV